MAALRESKKLITPQKTRNMVRQRASRLNKTLEKLLPTSPTLNTKVKKRLSNYLPRKEEMLDAQPLANPVHVNDHLLRILRIQRYKLRRNYDKMEIEIAKLKDSGSLMSIAKQLNARPKLLYSLTEMPKIKESDRKVNQDDIDSVKKALEDNTVSCELPHKRHQGKRFMRVTIVQAYKHYVSQQTACGDRVLSLSSFNRHKPWYMRLLRFMPDLGCQCDVCLNCSLKADALIANKVKGLSKRLTTNLFKTFCNRTNKNPEDVNIKDFGMECIRRKCHWCSVKRLKDELLRIEENQNLDWNKTVFHSKWESVKVAPKKEGDKDRTTFERKKKPSTLEQLLDEYLADLELMSLHQFNFRFQGEAFEKWMERLAVGDLLLVSDFGTNYSHKLLIEPQSKHWSRKQTTNHNTVCFFICPQGCGTIVKHEIVCLSDDRKHDLFAVDAFENRILQHFKQCKIPVKRIIRFTDNCATQYKSLKVFDLMSRKTIPYLLNHFGAKHGKGPADGVGGRMMQMLDRGINNGVVDITDAKTMAEYLTESVDGLVEAQANIRPGRKHHRTTQLEKAQIRRFFLSDEISRNFKGKRIVKLTLKAVHEKYIQFVKSQSNSEGLSTAISSSSLLRHKPPNVLTGVKCDPAETEVSAEDGAQNPAGQSTSEEGSHDARLSVPEDSLFVPDEEKPIFQKPRNDMCSHYRRFYFHVNKIDRSMDMSKARTVTMTRQIHSYRNTGVPGFMEVRRHSCSCDACLEGSVEAECENSRHVDNFARVNLYGPDQPLLDHTFENKMWKGRLSLAKKWKTTAPKKEKTSDCQADNKTPCAGAANNKTKNESAGQVKSKTKNCCDPGANNKRKSAFKHFTKRRLKQNANQETTTTSDDDCTFQNIVACSTNRLPRKTTVEQRQDQFTLRDKLPLSQLLLPDSDSDFLHLDGSQGHAKDELAFGKRLMSNVSDSSRCLFHSCSSWHQQWSC